MIFFLVYILVPLIGLVTRQLMAPTRAAVTLVRAMRWSQSNRIASQSRTTRLSDLHMYIACRHVLAFRHGARRLRKPVQACYSISCSRLHRCIRAMTIRELPHRPRQPVYRLDDMQTSCGHTVWRLSFLSLQRLKPGRRCSGGHAAGPVAGPQRKRSYYRAVPKTMPPASVGRA